MIVLDNKRLSNQRREGITILRGGWRYHPASKMWRDYTECLKLYINLCFEECERRGFINNTHYYDLGTVIYPHWFQDNRVHGSHRAALLYKDYKWYSQFGWIEKPTINYYWPQEIYRSSLCNQQNQMCSHHEQQPIG